VLSFYLFLLVKFALAGLFFARRVLNETGRIW